MLSARLIVLHSSDEMYGADRILLDLLAALPERIVPEVWLPVDLPHPEQPLCHVLAARSVRFRHVALPVLRRHYLHPRGLVGLAGRTLRLSVLLLRHRPDVVYCATSATLLGAPVARLLGVKGVLAHVQEVWAGQERLILHPLSLWCHRLVVASPTVYASLPRTTRQRAAIAENGTSEPGVRSEPDAAPGPVRFLVASRWSERKGYRTLLDAWNQAGCPGRLVVLGGPAPGPSVVDVPALVSQLSDPSSVEIVGEVADVGPYINAADVVVMPSDEPEGFGLVPVEAFARARAALVSDAGGLNDLVSHGVDGWTFRARDIDGLAALLTSLDRQQTARAGRRARLTYERRFTPTGFADRWRVAVHPWIFDERLTERSAKGAGR